MRTAAFAAVIILATGIAAEAGNNKADSGRVVPVCTPPVPGFPGAPMRAAEMFKRIGIDIKYLGANHCPAGALAISVSTRTPASKNPGALAYALPFEKTHIIVFLDRVRAFPRTEQDAILAHVLAHEITHILEGVTHHSNSGVMKAHWQDDDLAAMCRHPLSFAPEDLYLIQRGMEQRQARHFKRAGYAVP